MFRLISQKKLLTVFALSSLISIYSAHGMEKLNNAIRRNDIKTVTELLKDKDIRESINQPDNDGMTPLYCAVLENDIEVMKLLLQYGAQESINKVDRRWGVTPLWWGVTKDRPEMIKLLLFFGAQVTNKIKDINPEDETIIKLLKNPNKIKQFLSMEELEEFDKIAGKSKPDFMKFKELYDINIKYRSKDYAKKEEMVKEIFGMKDSEEKTKKLNNLEIMMKKDKELEEIVKRNRKKNEV